MEAINFCTCGRGHLGEEGEGYFSSLFVITCSVLSYQHVLNVPFFPANSLFPPAEPKCDILRPSKVPYL